jgi:2-polyprenyl-3-methyl-5-hydroxy-6-metoxy-1,4-benzoquinol methylase
MAGPVNTSYINVREDLLALIPDGPLGEVLDVGCANGATCAVLKQRHPGCRVTGIEYDAVLAEQARAQLDRVVHADASEGLAQLGREGQMFDLVLCGDVLEHLVDPWQALRSIRALTRGHVIVSLPNVAHFSTLWSLFAARRWPYRERGIHDRTHLRFFAASNLPELFADAGFSETRRKQHHRLLERPHPINEKLSGVLSVLPGISGLTCYQFLCVLRPT